jgi:phage RecT family recombinase
MADRTQSYAAHEQERKEEFKSIVSSVDRERDKYIGLLPSNVKWEDFRNAFLVAVQNNPRLLEADRPSFWAALNKAALAGLKPDGQEGAMVIFGDDSEDEDGNPVPSTAKGKKKVQWMPMVWGICKQMRNTGNIASIRCKVVYKGERVVIADENGQETYRHERIIEHDSPIDESDENIVGAYAVVAYKDGFWDAEFYSRKQIDRVKARARSKRGPWATHYPQQAMKTPLRRLSLRVEKSAENARYFQAISDDETLRTIDGDPATEVPPPALEQDQSIKQEFTKPPAKAAATTKRDPKPEEKQQQTPRSTHEPSTDDMGHSGVRGDRSDPAMAGAGDNSLAGQPETPVEIWATDENGEPADQSEPMNPREFAEWFSKRLFASNSDALIEHNADAIADCRSGDPKAFGDIESAIGRHIKRQQEKLTGGDEAPAATASTRKPVLVPQTPKGAQKWPEYGPLCFAEIEKLRDEADIADWIEVNRPTYKNRATEIAIENRLRARRAALAPEATLESAPMTGTEFLAVVTAQMAPMNTEEEIAAWCRGESQVAIMDRLKTTDRPMWLKIREVIDERLVAIQPAAAGE